MDSAHSPLVLKAQSRAGRALLGGKAWALSQLQDSPLQIPDWFVITPLAFDVALDKQVINDVPLSQLTDLVAGLRLPSNVQQIITAELQHWPDDSLFAVRSSAVEEDGQLHSYAGQLDSFLNIPRAEVAEHVLKVWQSAFHERVLSYRQSQGLELSARPPAVLVQLMVDAQVAGVAFGANPVSGSRSEYIVSAVSGLAEQLVSGMVNGDSYTLAKDGHVLEQQLLGPKPLLEAQQLHQLCETLTLCQEQFSAPQDIEWAINPSGTIYLLQSRPITSLYRLPDPDGVLTIWDNSNIVESYGGVTTPLTFAFIRYAYSEVYKSFCRILGVSEDKIASHQHVFNNMLGLLNGQVYYNLISWYRILALLPGFSVNHKFMEQMMGVKEGLPEDILQQVQGAGTWYKLVDILSMLRALLGLASNHWRLKGKIRRFYHRLDQSLQRPRSELGQMSAEELVAYYHVLEQELLSRWDAPLINDFLAMIFYGVLRKQVQKWGDGTANLQNELLTRQGEIISAEPIRYIRRLAAMARDDKTLLNTLQDIQTPAQLGRLRQWPEFAALLDEYLERFGDRCLEELKLESLTTREDPASLLATIIFLAQQETTVAEPEIQPPSAALQHLRKRLRWRPLRRLLFHWVLKHTRHRVRDRENLRFERTRIFGRVRLLYLELGKRLYAQGMLTEPRDVFYLESHEILGSVTGTATTTDFKGLVQLRQRQYAKYHQASPLPGRIHTRGGVHFGNDFYATEAAVPGGEHHDLQGIGCCPGIVEGTARVIIDPRQAQLKLGEILVAHHTDPGWVMLFTTAAGIVVERGSLLSHTAIVAREMHIPAVVAVDGLLETIHDGDTIRLDGTRGSIEIINKKNTHGTPA